jgi:AraC family transcriptional regulator
MMGDVVTSFEQVPDGLTEFEIPVGTYAVFPVRPKNRFGWAIAIANTKRYAYGVWLPGSGYEPAGTIDDFEYHDERSTRKRDPEIDLYVAVTQKGQKEI